MTMGIEQRRQKEYFNRKVHSEPFKEGDFFWLFQPHKAKSRKFYLPWPGPFKFLSRTSRDFNRLKAYRGNPEVRHSGRLKSRHPPIYEEIPNEIETKEGIEDRPFHVFKPTPAESQAARNRPKVTFSRLPEIVEQDFESETENRSHDENSEGLALPQLTAYET